MYNFYNPYPAQQFNSQQLSGQQIIKVNGENGAMAYQMSPNSSALLLDESAPIVWLKQTDGAGYPTITPYKIEPYSKPDVPDYGSILKRIERLEGMINESNHAAVEQSNKTANNERSCTDGKRGPGCVL